jgi:hypothetical protein
VQEIPPAGLQEHVQYFLDAFPTTPLVLPWGDEQYQNEVYDWAIAQGVGMRREGLFHNSDGSEVSHCLGSSPAIFEYAPTQYASVRTAENLAAFIASYPHVLPDAPTYEELLQSDDLVIQTFGDILRALVEIGMPTYLSLGGWMGPPDLDAAVMLSEQAELVAELNNRVGYHFHLSRATVPSVVRQGEPTAIELVWENTGVAHIHVPCHVVLGLFDEAENLQGTSWCESCDPASWPPDTTTTEQATMVFVDLPPGPYTLAIALFQDPGDDSPTIRLGTVGSNDQGWLPLTTLQLTEPR